MPEAVERGPVDRVAWLLWVHARLHISRAVSCTQPSPEQLLESLGQQLAAAAGHSRVGQLWTAPAPVRLAAHLHLAQTH